MAVKAKLQGLEPARTYHYRLALTTPQGTIYGADRTLAPSRWASQAASNRPTTDDEQLMGVSCPKDGWCMGVDWRYISKVMGSSLARTCSTGASGASCRCRRRAGAVTRRSIVSLCTSTSNCIAVGRVRLEALSFPGREVERHELGGQIGPSSAHQAAVHRPTRRPSPALPAPSAWRSAISRSAVPVQTPSGKSMLPAERRLMDQHVPAPAERGQNVGSLLSLHELLRRDGNRGLIDLGRFVLERTPQAVNARFSGVSCTSQSSAWP